MEAICEGDTLKRDFVVFSIDDKRPATETKDWFWQSDGQFPNDGTPVTVQVGSSDKDVHIVYSIFGNDKIIETGAVDKSNELINRKFIYKEEYGDGITLNFAWVKNGKCYTHHVSITRPMPDNKLKLEWSTFRDRLTPGQEEEWALTVKGPDGKPADAMLMATLYDKSLDQLKKHQWYFHPYTHFTLTSTQWIYPDRYKVAFSGRHAWSWMTERDLLLSHFDESVFPFRNNYATRGFGGGRVGGAAVLKRAVGNGLPVPEAAVLDEAVVYEDALLEWIS